MRISLPTTTILNLDNISRKIKIDVYNSNVLQGLWKKKQKIY